MNNASFRSELIKKSLILARKTLKIVDKFPSKISSRVIADQLIRSVTSIGANIVEAQAASSKKDFINFLSHALKSANETRYWLILSKELDVKLDADLNLLLKDTEELCRILGSSLRTLRASS